MYHPSPVRQIYQQPSVSRSVSPVSQVKIVGNTTPPPPGMKTILKPKVYEAVEIPYQSYKSMPQYLPQNIEQEIQIRLKATENELQYYKNEVQHSKEIINQLNEQLSNNQKQGNNKILQEQCDYYFNQYQQSELEKNELQLKLQQQTKRNNGEWEQKCIKLQQEVDQWKQKLYKCEENNNNQIELLKSEFDKIYSDHFKSMKSNSDTKCNALEEQLIKNQRQLDEVIQEAEQWRDRYHQEDMSKLEQASKLSELELLTLHQQKEIERLNLVNLQKTQEVDIFKQKINQLEFNHQQISQQGLEYEVKRLKDQLECRQKEINDLKKRNSDIEQTVLKLKDAQIQLDILKSRSYITEGQLQESDRYKHINQALQMEIEEQKQKQLKYENQITEMKKNEYRQNLEIQRLTDILRMKDEEMSKMQLEYKKNIQSLQNQMNQFKNIYENDLMSNQSNRKYIDSSQQNEDKIAELQEELSTLKKERESLHQACSQLSTTKLQLENKILIMVGEIERLNGLLKAKEEELSNYKESINMLQEQYEQLQQQYELQKRELDLFKTRSNSRINNSSSQKKFDLFHQHQDSNWN